MGMPDFADPFDFALRQLQDFGMEVSALDTSGQRQYCHVEGDKRGTKKGWYVAYLVSTNDGRQIVVGAYGWYKEPDTSHKFRIQSKGMSAQDRLEVKRKAAAAAAQAQQLRQEAAEDAARRAAEIWPKLPDAGSSPYLDRKGVRAFGVRFSRGSIVLPMRTADNRLVGLQFIDPEGQKRFLTGTAKAGAFHMLGDPGESPKVVGIAEGYSTAATVHLAMRPRWPVATAFDCGNLKPVALALRSRWPQAVLVILGDDDRGRPGNPGRTAAEAAVKAVGGLVMLPPLGEAPGTDWNDLQQAIGVDGVRDALAALWESSKPAPPPASNVVSIGTAGMEWQARLQRNDKGNLKASAFNLRLILENDPAWKGVIGWCEFSARVMKRALPPFAHASRGEWEDADDAELRFWMGEHYGIEPKGQDLADPIMGVARASPFHPVREYLGRLQWDGVKRVDFWLESYLGCTAYGEEEGPVQPRQRDLRYIRRVSALTLIQGVARVRAPGCKADYVLILEGAQGRRKSTSLRVLFGEEWFSDTPVDIGSKDAYESIRGLWCFEMAELDSLNKADATRAKAFFSSATDRFRMPYGHRAQRHPRQCVVCGTTNQSAYLKDQTGNRRYWPVQCGEIDIEALAEVRDQLWAEADQRFRSGEPWWPQDEDREVFETEQDARVDADAWEPLIQDYLNKRLDESPPGARRDLFLTGAEIMKGALDLDPGAMRRPEQTRVGYIMQGLGWRGTRPWRAGERMRGYQPGAKALELFEERVKARRAELMGGGDGPEF